MDNRTLVPLDTSGVSPPVQQLLDFLKQEIKGQEAAVQAVGEAFEIYWAGLKYPDEPIFVLMCLGPSGVGKTLLAEMIAKHFFNNRHGLTKVECGSFGERHEYARLIGSPPGYIGYNEEPLLSQWNIDKHHYASIIDKNGYKEILKKVAKLSYEIDEISKKLEELNEKRIEDFDPKKGVKQYSEFNKLIDEIRVLEREKMKLELRLKKMEKVMDDIEKNSGDLVYSKDKKYLSVVLFDEIEKADESLRNLMLEITDKGRLTLSNGKVTGFENSFIIITSNLGSRDIGRLLGGSGMHIGFMKTASKSSREEIGDQNPEIHKYGMNALKEAFSPEFIGRLDGVVIFQPLNEKVLFEILDLKITEMAVFLNDLEKPLRLEIDLAVKDYFVRQALQYREEGARFLRKQLRNHVLLNLAKLFNGDILNPGDAVVIKRENDQIRFYKELSDQTRTSIVPLAE